MKRVEDVRWHQGAPSDGLRSAGVIARPRACRLGHFRAALWCSRSGRLRRTDACCEGLTAVCPPRTLAWYRARSALFISRMVGVTDGSLLKAKEYYNLWRPRTSVRQRTVDPARRPAMCAHWGTFVLGSPVFALGAARGAHAVGPSRQNAPGFPPCRRRDRPSRSAANCVRQRTDGPRRHRHPVLAAGCLHRLRSSARSLSARSLTDLRSGRRHQPSETRTARCPRPCP